MNGNEETISKDTERYEKAKGDNESEKCTFYGPNAYSSRTIDATAQHVDKVAKYRSTKPFLSLEVLYILTIFRWT